MKTTDGVAKFRDGPFDANSTLPMAGGGSMVVGRYPPAPPGRRYQLDVDAAGGCTVVVVSIGGPVQTSDTGAVLREMNRANRQRWGQPPLPGPAR